MSDMLSQDEINALIAGASGDDLAKDSAGDSSTSLTEEEKDILGEIGNINMGTAATTLFTLLNQKVTITTPKVSEVYIKDVFARFENPYVTIDVNYTVGLKGKNLMILNHEDVKIITDLMLGGDGSNIEGELNEMHLSAISEAMNQMIGSSSTSLSEMIGKKIDISPPVATYNQSGEDTAEKEGFLDNEKVVMISFAMKIGTLVDSEIMQMIPMEMARELLNTMKGGSSDDKVEPVPELDPIDQMLQPDSMQQVLQQENSGPPPKMEASPQGVTYQQKPQQPVDAKNVQFANFAPDSNLVQIRSDIELIKDVPLEITVELGRTVRKISDILDFVSGSIIELDKLVGDPLDILANGKVIARGEVVVIEENYGVRITEIVVPEQRF